MQLSLHSSTNPVCRDDGTPAQATNTSAGEGPQTAEEEVSIAELRTELRKLELEADLC